ncbi:MAG: YncE family protein [Chromatiales bacterium]|nr:YncE family protein [Chromatiales bacterium]
MLAAPLAYVPNALNDNVSVIDLATQATLTTIPVGVYPYGVAPHPLGTHVLIGNLDSDSVSVIDTATQTVIATIAVGDEPNGVAFHPSGAQAYVVNLADESLSVIDTATWTVSTTVTGFPVFSYPSRIAVHPAGHSVYVGLSGGYDAVQVIDTASLTLGASVAVGNEPRGIAVDPAGATLYVADHADDTVSVVDIATLAVIDTVPVGTGPLGVVVDPAGDRVYVANLGSGDVTTIDAATRTVVATSAPAVSGLAGIDITADGASVYTTAPADNALHPLDTASPTLLGAPIAVGAQPLAMGRFILPEASTPVPALAPLGAGLLALALGMLGARRMRPAGCPAASRRCIWPSSGDGCDETRAVALNPDTRACLPRRC